VKGTRIHEPWQSLNEDEVQFIANGTSYLRVGQTRDTNYARCHPYDFDTMPPERIISIKLSLSSAGIRR